MSALIPYTNLSVVTQPQIVQRDPITAIKPADQTVNNSTTLINDSALFVTVAASAVYRFELELRYNTNTTANIKNAWTFPAGLTMRYESVGFAAGTSVLDIFASDQTTVNGFSGSRSVARSTGTITVAGTAGNLQMQFAQSTANASNTTVQAGSYLLLYQIA